MLPLWLLVALVAVGLPVVTLTATQTVGCQHRAALRRRQGCKHAIERGNDNDAAFFREGPKGHR